MWVVMVAKWRVKYYIAWSTNGAIYVDTYCCTYCPYVLCSRW